MPITATEQVAIISRIFEGETLSSDDWRKLIEVMRTRDVIKLKRLERKLADS